MKIALTKNKMKTICPRYLPIIFIILIFAVITSAFAIDVLVISEEDILIAQLKLQEINQKKPEEIERYKKQTLGMDPRVGKIIEERYTCADIYPAYGSVFLHYQGVDSEEQCLGIGGIPKYSPGWHSYAGCSPKPVNITIHLKSGEIIENVNVLGKNKYFIQVENAKGSEGIKKPKQEASFFLSDIVLIKSQNGKVFDGFKKALNIPEISNNPKKQARKYFEDTGMYYPFTASSWYYKAKVEPVVLLQKAIEYDPAFSEAYYKLYELYGELSIISYGVEMVTLMEKLITIHPTDAKAHYLLGKAYPLLWGHKTRRYTASRDVSHFNIKNKEELYARAINMLNKAIELDPELIHTYRFLSQWYSNIHKYPEAIKYMEKWIKLAKPEGKKLEKALRELDAYKSHLE